MRTLPRWLGWSGVLVAILSVFSFVLFGLPLILDLVWVLAVSWLIVQGAAPERAAPTPG